MRKYYVDNIRWIIILLLVPYHAAMAWNIWGEPNLSGLLSIGGKSLAEYTYVFLVGYYIFSNDDAINNVEKYKWVFLCIGMAATFWWCSNIFCFIFVVVIQFYYMFYQCFWHTGQRYCVVRFLAEHLFGK